MPGPPAEATPTGFVNQVGTAATYFPQSIRSVEDLIHELRAGRFNVVDLREGG